MKKVLISGNLGFIGSYLVGKLREEGYEVRGIDNNPNGKAEYPHTTGDVVVVADVEKAMQETDCIVHLAAEHRDFGITDEAYFRVNETGTRNLLEEAGKNHVTKFVFFSSVAVYGDQQHTTEETPLHPETPYGKSKQAAESLVREWTLANPERSSLIIRPVVVFGPRNTANIFRLIRQVCDGRFVWVGDGRSIKSIAYVENLVDATLFLMRQMKPGVEVYNYADSPHLSTHDLVHLIAKKASKPVPGFHIPLGIASTLSILFDVAGRVTGRDFPITSARLKKFNSPTYHKAEKIRRAGFSPRFTIEDGIEKNVRWYMDRKGRHQEIHHTSE